MEKKPKNIRPDRPSKIHFDGALIPNHPLGKSACLRSDATLTIFKSEVNCRNCRDKIRKENL